MISQFKKSALSWMLFPVCLSTAAFCWAKPSAVQLTQLSDSELSNINGQALMSMSFLAPKDQDNPMRNIGSNTIGFYKLGLEAELNLNANIANLQLGCGGGDNREGKCDIDIKNLALSGLPDSYDADGVPVFNNGRASTSGTITNPFVEFAINNPNSLSEREIKGLRFSAEKISALLTAGLENTATPSQNDGIQSLSGYMQIAATSGTANTLQTTFGKSQTQQIGGYAALCAGLIAGCSLYNRDIHFVSNPGSNKTTGITVPSVTTSFDLPAFVVNGVRQDKALINDIRTNIGTIPIASDGTSAYPASLFSNDQLRVNLDCNGVSGGSGLIGCSSLSFLKDEATFKMGTGSKIQNLNMKIDFEQALSMIHNIPLTGTGGYLSLQDIALIWPGAKIASGDLSKTNLKWISKDSDVAQPGWWMSFNDPVQLGKLNVTQPVILDDATLAQVAQRVTQSLGTNNPNKPEARAPNLVALGLLLLDQPLTSQVIADLGDYTRDNPVYLKLQNQQLGNQTVKSNCYGNLKFC